MGGITCEDGLCLEGVTCEDGLCLSMGFPPEGAGEGG